MGCFVSKQEVPGDQAAEPDTHKESGLVDAVKGAQHDDLPRNDPKPDAKETPIMQQVKQILQELLLISEGPAACEEAASVLHAGLKGAVSTVTLTVSSDKPGVSVLLAAEGQGSAALMQQQLVLSGSSWSANWLAAQPQLPQALYRTAATGEEAASLPQDWALLYRHAALHSFLAVPITSNGTMLGVLGLASSQPNAFTEYWWEPLLSIVCTGLVRLMRSCLVGRLVGLMTLLAATKNANSFAATLLQGATTLLESHTNMLLGVRFGLLGPDKQQLLLLHSKRCSTSRSRDPSFVQQSVPQGNESMLRCVMAALSASAADDVALLRMPAANTLMLDALDRNVARFVRNTAAYLEGVSEPSHDVFVDEEEVVSSIVVAPLTVAGQPYGALYVTHHLPWSQGPGFMRCKSVVVGLAGLLQRLLAQHVAGNRDKAWQELIESHLRHNSGLRLEPGTPRAASQRNNGANFESQSTSSASAAAAAGSAAAAGDSLPSPFAAAAAAAAPAGSSSMVGGQQAATLGNAQPGSGDVTVREPVATSSMVEMLRLQVQRSKDRQRHVDRDAAYVEGLQLKRLLGKGGFGSVFEGTWNGSPAAIKVMYVQQHERQLMKNAMEMAVLTTIRHPNVVRVYACLTDMLEEAAPDALPGSENIHRRFRPAHDGSSLAEGCSSLCNIVVMEVCDRGNLRHAMRRGLLHKRTQNKGLVVDMRLLVTVLLEVARSIQHLHSLQIIHCDVKAENVLLKSNSASPVGFVCKLGDFGLVKLLLGKYYITNRSGSGTVTHLAPELFEAGSKVTSAVDAYAFGIMMYELYSCQRLYAGMAAESIVQCVLRQQGRPQFPPGAPAAYQCLAEKCWSQDKNQRPTFDEIVKQLQVLLDAAGGPFMPAPSSDICEDQD